VCFFFFGAMACEGIISICIPYNFFLIYILISLNYTCFMLILFTVSCSSGILLSSSIHIQVSTVSSVLLNYGSLVHL
jgi:hypothetical protein